MIGSCGAYWGELAALTDPAPGATLLRTVGFDPAVATIRLDASDVADWAIRVDPGRFEGLEPREVSAPAIAAQLVAAAPAAFTPLQGLPYRDDLVLLLESGEPVAVPNMWLQTARAIEALDGKPDVVELVLVDVRKWWVDYGVVSRSYNVPNGRAADETVLYERASLKDGRLWAPSEIVQDLLDHLPGKVRLVYWPREAVAPAGQAAAVAPSSTPTVLPPAPSEARVLTLECAGASPREVLAGVLEDLGLLFTLTLSGGAACWRPGEGGVGETADDGAQNSRGHDLLSGEGVWAGMTPDDGFGYSRTVAVDAPDEVLVTGARPIRTVVVDYLDHVVIRETAPEGGGAAVRRAYEVTPELIGELDGREPQPEDLARILKAPVLRSSEDGALENTSRESQELLTAQVGRIVRVPRRLRYLLPILARAERGPDGERLAPVVEAFGWQPLEIEIAPEDLTAFDARAEADRRSEIERSFAEVDQQLARVRAQIAAQTMSPEAARAGLDFVVEEGVLPAVRSLLRYGTLPGALLLGDDGAALQRQGALPGTQPRTPTTPPPPEEFWDAFQRAGTALQGIVEGGLDATVGFLGGDDELLAEGQREIAQGREALNELFPDGAELDQLRRTETDLVRRRLELLQQLDPARALQERINDINRRIVESAATGVDQALLAQLADLQRQKRELEEAPENERAAKQPIRRIIHENLPRRPVRYRVLDADEGLLELDEPCGILADANVADPSETWVILLPARIAFGSWNRGDVVQPDGLPRFGVTDNLLMGRAAAALAADAQLRVLAGGMGHWLPPETDRFLELRFSRADMSGGATLGPFPYRITDPRLQRLVELPVGDAPGGDNLEELRQLARAAAEKVMSSTVREAGTVLVLGPRRVNLNGRIAGTTWAMDDEGQIDTTISFDRSEPFPGIDVAQVAPRDPRPHVYGFDPRDHR